MKDINANKGDDSIDTFLINEEAVLMNFQKIIHPSILF